MWGQIVGAGIGAAASLFGARSQNKAARASAREQMAFQERMSNTSYQRSMADMRKAGLNPILAYQKGGASTPGGAQAPVVNPAGEIASNARELATQLANLRNIKSITDLNREKQKTQLHLTNSAKSAATINKAKSIPFHLINQAAGQVERVYTEGLPPISGTKPKLYKSSMSKGHSAKANAFWNSFKNRAIHMRDTFGKSNKFIRQYERK